MRRIRSPIGILQGSRMMFSDFADGGQMWTGHGARESRFAVEFAEPFAGRPAVMVGLSMWDMDHKSNQRADVAAEGVTAEGFQIVFRTWGDSRIARVRADWTAIGPLKDDEDWEVD